MSNHIQTIANSLGKTEPVNGTWIEAIASLDGNYLINSLTANTVNIDFTDTLDFVSEEDGTFIGPVIFITGLGWVALNGTVDFLGRRYDWSGITMDEAVSEGSFPIGMGSSPIKGWSATMAKESDTSKSVVAANVTNRIDPDGNNTSAALDGTFRVDTDTENERYRVVVEGVDDDTARLLLQKTNNAGEQVTQSIDSTSTGFITSNDLADDTASIHRFDNNDSDSILDLLNDNLQSDVLLSNNFSGDTAAGSGGVPVGGLYHNAGALRIRLAS